MCTTLFAYHHLPDFPLVMLSNRDEFHNRATAPAGVWEDAPEIVGGRDLDAGGTWLAVSPNGRFGNLTNYRDFRDPFLKNAPSRGQFIPDFIHSDQSPMEFMGQISQPESYNGFSLLVGDLQHLAYFSNKGGEPTEVAPGIHGLSNHLLDTPWPKVEMGKKAIAEILAQPQFHPDDFFALSLDTTLAPDPMLPDTGANLDFERRVSPLFIRDGIYGTRCTTLVLMNRVGEFGLWEKRFNGEGQFTGESRWGIFAETPEFSLGGRSNTSA